MIHVLGAWVLKGAGDAAPGWCRFDGRPATPSVHVSALQINRHFLAVIEECLGRSAFPPCAPKLGPATNERAVIEDTEVPIRCAAPWKAVGILIAVDDVGNGYSSLSCLSSLPIERLTTGQSLIPMATDPRSVIIVRSIVALAEELGIDVLAEGLETEQPVEMIIDPRCPRAQQYLLGRPLSASQAQIALRQPWRNHPVTAHRSVGNAIGERRVH
jgi:EAL domain-containing protein (putative c-di-GMP-specific phosphodiesterase class I)